MHNAQCTIKARAAKGFGGDRKAPEKGRATCFVFNLALSVSKYKKLVARAKINLKG